VRPYLEPAPLAALFLGISSGTTNAMIGASGIGGPTVVAYLSALCNLRFTARQPTGAWVWSRT
jgi:hypothetical protein